MADFEGVLRKTLKGMTNPSADAREMVYERARTTIARQVEAMEKRPSEAAIQRQYDKLSAAIANIERSFTDRKQTTPDPRENPFAGFENIPKPESQNPTTLRYTYDNDGPITIDLTAGADEVAHDEASIQRYREVREVAESFAAHVARTSALANQFPYLAKLASSYLVALGETIESLSPDLLVMRGDRLRNELASQEHIGDDENQLHQVPDLPPSVLMALRNLVAAHNLFTALDPLLDSKDQAMLGPDANLPLASPVDGKRYVERALSDGVIDRATAEILDQQADASPIEPDSSNRLSRRYSGSLRNLARAIISRAYSSVEEHWTKVAFAGGTAVVSVQCLKWIVANQQWLLDFFSGNQNMAELINFLVRLATRLPIA